MNYFSNNTGMNTENNYPGNKIYEILYFLDNYDLIPEYKEIIQGKGKYKMIIFLNKEIMN